MKKLILAALIAPTAFAATTASAATVTAGMASTSTTLSGDRNEYYVAVDSTQSGFINIDSDSMFGTELLGIGAGYTDVEGGSVLSMYFKPKVNMGFFQPNESFAKKVTIYGKIGASAYRLSDSNDNTADSSMMYGLGTHVAINDSWGVDFHYDSLYSNDVFELTSVNLGVAYTF